MSDTVIIKAASIITVDAADSRAEAIAVDTGTGRIVAVGSLADCQTAAPDATVTDLGTKVLLPGFVDAHNHPVHVGRDDAGTGPLDRAVRGLSHVERCDRVLREVAEVRTGR